MVNLLPFHHRADIARCDRVLCLSEASWGGAACPSSSCSGSGCGPPPQRAWCPEGWITSTAPKTKNVARNGQQQKTKRIIFMIIVMRIMILFERKSWVKTLVAKKSQPMRNWEFCPGLAPPAIVCAASGRQSETSAAKVWSQKIMELKAPKNAKMLSPKCKEWQITSQKTTKRSIDASFKTLWALGKSISSRVFKPWRSQQDSGPDSSGLPTRRHQPCRTWIFDKKLDLLPPNMGMFLQMFASTEFG